MTLSSPSDVFATIETETFRSFHVLYIVLDDFWVWAGSLPDQGGVKFVAFSNSNFLGGCGSCRNEVEDSLVQNARPRSLSNHGCNG